ncbi:MAG: vWA domain-containing protein [Candidatus Sericytochromatia bacterium]|nr:vWA domain-containing protein [Candidatus Sericytochromatia bacterium]
MKLRTSHVCAPLAAALLLSGCALPAGAPTAAASRGDAGATRSEGGVLGRPVGAAASAAPSSGKAAAPERNTVGAEAGGSLVSDVGAPMMGTPAAAPPMRDMGPDMRPMPPRASAVPAPGGEQVRASDLKAGAVDDNKGFKAYMEYLAQFDWGAAVMAPRKMDVARRKVLTVVDAAGRPVHDAQVTVTAFPDAVRGPNDRPVVGRPAPSTTLLRTYADGRALYHPQPADMASEAGSVDVTATKGNATVTAKLALDADSLTLTLPEPVARPGSGAPLDVAFVIDATGSMGGEIRKFQASMGSIAERIKMLPQAPQVRFALVSYRDQGEAYVTKVENFTSSMGDFQARLNEVSASGGGDKPEDMEAALRDTVNTLAWTADGAVRLSFVVADAAPHTDYPQATPYTASMARAAATGVKFYPIGASSLEREGEYVMRQLAQWTMGQYLFVTRGGDEASGGGGTASAEVDKFKEGRLDDIVVDIVKAELSHLGQ